MWNYDAGERNLLDDEAIQVGGSNHSHATQDLYDNIADGQYPEWTLYIQTMEPRDEDKFDFDPLDVTKIWPEHLFPLQPVGRLVLNQNPSNFFTENEMLVSLLRGATYCVTIWHCSCAWMHLTRPHHVCNLIFCPALLYFAEKSKLIAETGITPWQAYCPALIVPGIGYSDDKMLQTRIFSYADSQRHRLGPNYLLLPANAPKSAHHNNHHEGFMNFMHRDEEVRHLFRASRFWRVNGKKKLRN